MQPLKKTIIMTAGAGAEILPYMKPFAVLPCSLVVTWYFLYLIHKFDRNRVFRILILSFLGYFALYTFILRPYREVLCADTLATILENYLPNNFNAAPTMVRYWMDTLFYVAAELWGSAILSTLMWGIVNEISTYEEAKNYYAYFTVAINSSGIFAGQLLSQIMCSPYNESIAYGRSQWDQCFLKVMLVIFAVTSLTLLIFRNFVNAGFSETAHDRETLCEKTDRKSKKKQLGLFQSISSLLKSPHLLYIATIVIGYNLVYNLSDVVLNKQIHTAYANDFNALTTFLGNIDKYKSLLATFLALFVSRYCLNNFGWTFAALVTPVAYIVTGSLFYMSFIFNIHGWTGYTAFMAIDPTVFILYLGGLHFCATKGTKYSLFDATKEMSYLGLDSHEKTSGKAVIDGVASRFGKSGGSFIMFALFALVGNDISLATPYIFAIVMFISFLWLIAVVNLGKRFSKADKNNVNISAKSQGPAAVESNIPTPA